MLALIIPLLLAHSHNDYEQKRPLLDALDRGFCSVEVDVHARGSELLVGHTGGDLEPGRTLQKLYLDPLLKRVRANGGRVYPGGPSLTLLVEAKSDADETWLALQPLLHRYSEMLTSWDHGRMKERAVTVVITGNRNMDLLRKYPLRYAAIDGDIGDAEEPKDLVPMVSVGWRGNFTWRGQGPMDAVERNRMERMIARAHKGGKRIRFWGAPDVPAAWEVLHAAGVDLINTDDLDGLARFLRDRR